jgi:hypothetical protein
MAITREMVLLRMEDIEAFAEARSLVRLCRELVDGAASDALRATLRELHLTASGIAASVAEALRAGEPRGELRRLRDAGLALAGLRLQSWDALMAGAIGVPRFDAIMTSSARCRRELEVLEAAVRRRARRRIDLDE